MRARAILAASAVYFLAGISLGVALGAARRLLLEPQIGAVWATLTELPVILGLLALCARAIAGRLRLSIWEGAAVGACWFAAFLAAEFALGGLLRGWTPAQTLGHFRTPEGLLGLVGFAVAATFPALAARAR